MTEHTPGPWYVSGTSIYSGGAIRPSGAGRPKVAECSYTDADVVTEATRNANRALIAAAPDLLAACQLALGDVGGDSDPTAIALREAVAKATGGER